MTVKKVVFNCDATTDMNFDDGNAIIDANAGSQFGGPFAGQPRLPGLEIPNRPYRSIGSSAVASDEIRTDASVQVIAYRITGTEALFDTVWVDTREIKLPHARCSLGVNRDTI